MVSFSNDLRRGKVGEAMFIDYLTRSGAELTDTSGNEEYWRKDIDLILADGTSYEVKTDYRSQDTGNLAIEFQSVYWDGTYKDGWLRTSEADKFVFVQPDKGLGFCISASKLKMLISSHRVRVAHTDDGYKTVYFYLLPLGQYQDWFEVLEMPRNSGIC